MTVVSWRKQLTLAVVLFVLGSFAYWLEFKHKPDAESQDETAKLLFTLKDIPVQSVSLHNGAGTVTLNCLDMGTQLCKPGDNSKWELQVPLKARADDANVNSLINTLNTTRSAETIDLKGEKPDKKQALLKDYGLDSESLKASNRSVDLTTSKGKSTLLLGGTHPIGDGIFALLNRDGKIDDGKVYLIPSFFKSSLDHDLAYWRDKKLVNFTAREVASFHLKSSKADVTGDKTPEGQWNLKSKGTAFSGDSENIDNLLSSVSYLNAKRFVSDSKTDPQAKTALRGARTLLSLTVQKSGEAKPTPITLTLFEKSGPALYATLSNADPLYELENNVRNRMDKNLNDLRLSKLITSIEHFTAKRLEFSSKALGPKPIVLNHKDAKWYFEDQKAADSEKVQITLDKLSGGHIKDFLEGSKIPQGEASGLKITLGDDKTPTKRQLLFWKANSKLYVRDLQSKRREAFAVDTSIQDGLPWQSGYYDNNHTPMGK